jgi:hypothetical protein
MYCGRQFQHYIQPFTNALLSNGDFGFVQFNAGLVACLQGMMIGQ